MSAEYEILELHPAYVWDCANCGRENFQRAISHALDPRKDEDAEAIASFRGQEFLDGMMEDLDHGESPHYGVQVVGSPRFVICKFCDCQFAASFGGKLTVDEDDCDFDDDDDDSDLDSDVDY